MKKNLKGYTLIEFITVITIIIILSLVFTRFGLLYLEDSDRKKVESEIGSLIIKIEAHRSTNASYKGFPIVATSLPNEQAPIYKIYVYDIVTGKLLNDLTSDGRGWAIKGVSSTEGNRNYLANSYGTRCYNEEGTTTLYSCGSNSVKW